MVGVVQEKGWIIRSPQLLGKKTFHKWANHRYMSGRVRKRHIGAITCSVGEVATKPIEFIDLLLFQAQLRDEVSTNARENGKFSLHILT
jgi:hypothetical protein